MTQWSKIVLCCALLAAATLVPGVSARANEEGAAAVPGLAAIEAARSAGEITDAEAILYKVYFVKGSARLPKRFELAGGDRIKCGTQILLEAMEAMPTLPLEMQRELKNLMVRPTLAAFMDTPHFRVHYSTSGTNMIYGWPNTAYRDSVMASCEKSWNFMHVTQQWQVPPSDGSNGGGSGLIDCYVTDVGSGIYGYTQSESPAPNWPSDWTAYFVIDHAYDGFGYSDRTLPMKVTVAHEYHHVVQMGYTISNNWWMENMSTFMEDEVYDSINDNYAYFSCYTSKPYKKLALFDGCHEYACFIWPTMIKERFLHDYVRQVQHCAAGGTNVYTCFSNVFGQSGFDFSDVLAEWGIWNFYTLARNDGNHYIEGGSYPGYMAYDLQFSTYPQMAKHPTATKIPEATAQSVMRLVRNTTSTDNLLTINYRGPACTKLVCLIVKTAGQQIFTEYYMNLDAAGDGTMDIPNWNLAEYGHLIAHMPMECGNGTFDFEFDALTSQSTAVEEPALYTRTVRLEQNEPNPFGPETRISYQIDLPSQVSLGIFDAAGRQVRSLIQAQQAEGRYTIRWDGRDDDGQPAPRGVYFYRLQAGEDAQVRKMVLNH